MLVNLDTAGVCGGTEEDAVSTADDSLAVGGSKGGNQR